MNAYQHPIALPLFALATGLCVMAASATRLMDGVSLWPLAGTGAGVVLIALAGMDLVRRRRMSRRR